MLPFLKKHKINLILALLIVFGGVLRFYNLNWGAPFYFHPDERNIASSVTQLNFPLQMDPHFFAYGSLPIYLIYFTGLLFNLLNGLHVPGIVIRFTQVDFSEAIIISRFYSAVFALLLIPIMYVIGKKIRGELTGILAAFLTAASVGFVQFAHFGTFEMWLTFFSVLLFWECLLYLKKNSFLHLFLLSFYFGILCSVKVSHLALLPIPLLVIFVAQFHRSRIPAKLKAYWKKRKLQKKQNEAAEVESVKFLEETEPKHTDLNQMVLALGRFSHHIIRDFALFFILSLLIFVVTNPFVFITTSDFFGSMHYEASVALGTMKVFYSGEFLTAMPVIYQIMRVFPFLINPFLTMLFLVSFGYLLYLAIKTRKFVYILIILFFLCLFCSQAFLYVKWTRYMLPTLPLIYLMTAIAGHDFLQKNAARLTYFVFGIIAIICIVFSLAYFMTAFAEPDTRGAAVRFAKQTIPSDANITSEVYDLGITPFNSSYPKITLFNFYDLDNNSPESTPETLSMQLADTDYIILPSQRILKIRMLDKYHFPQGHAFYAALENGGLGFSKIYQTPCDIWCKITYLNDPIYSFEETASVFDRPTVMIFKRIRIYPNGNNPNLSE